MSTALDNVWILAGLLGIGAALCAFLFARGGGPKALAWCAVLLCGIAALFLLDRLVETPVEQARKSLDQLIDAARAGDADAIVRLIATSYSDGSRDRAGLESIVRRNFSHARLNGVSVGGLQMTNEPDGSVSAKFVAHVSGEYLGHSTGGDSYPVRLRIDFTPEQSIWKMSRVRRFDPIQSAKEISLDRVP